MHGLNNTQLTKNKRVQNNSANGKPEQEFTIRAHLPSI